MTFTTIYGAHQAAILYHRTEEGMVIEPVVRDGVTIAYICKCAECESQRQKWQGATGW